MNLRRKGNQHRLELESCLFYHQHELSVKALTTLGQVCMSVTCDTFGSQVLWHRDVGDGHAGSSALSGTVQRGGGQVRQ